MNLEIKHLASYLPYGLEVLVENYNGLKWKQKVTIENYVNYFDKKYINENIKIINPILRPLSNFKEEQIEEIKEFLAQNWCEVYDDFFDALFEHD
jgi:dUTPase